MTLRQLVHDLPTDSMFPITIVHVPDEMDTLEASS